MLSAESFFYKAVPHACSTYFQPKLKIHTEKKNQRLSKERQSWREDSKELRGREVGSCGSTYICSHRPTNSRVDTPDTLALQCPPYIYKILCHYSDHWLSQRDYNYTLEKQDTHTHRLETRCCFYFHILTAWTTLLKFYQKLSTVLDYF